LLDTGQFGVPQTFSPNGAFHRKAIYKERQQQSESERGDVGLLQSRQAPADQNRPRARHVLTPTLSIESDQYDGLGGCCGARTPDLHRWVQTDRKASRIVDFVTKVRSAIHTPPYEIA
jgi:hypothetical protein